MFLVFYVMFVPSLSTKKHFKYLQNHSRGAKMKRTNKAIQGQGKTWDLGE